MVVNLNFEDWPELQPISLPQTQDGKSCAAIYTQIRSSRRHDFSSPCLTEQHAPHPFISALLSFLTDSLSVLKAIPSVSLSSLAGEMKGPESVTLDTRKWKGGRGPILNIRITAANSVLRHQLVTVDKLNHIKVP